VDREERPDIDQIYMDAVQMLNGHGGWPLNVFCLPDGRPFAGGTYFPPNDHGGHNIVPWPQLLIRVADYYQRQRNDLEANARAIIGNLQASNTPHQCTGDPVSRGDLMLAVNRLLENQDPEFGGFGTSPKFPPAMSLDFLLSMRASATIESGFPQKAAEIDVLVNRTLTAMAHGGIFDQIGGGFARYSVDQLWLIPHFEKMLYDNALLIDIYSKASQRYPGPLYRQVVEETIGWLEREMAAGNGAFYSALDADTDGREGATYLWSPDEVIRILGEETGKAFCETYGISKGGNFEASGLSNPALLSGDPGIRDGFRDARLSLLRSRNQRPQPGRDEKCLVAWNALLLRGMARAGFIFGNRDWLSMATGIAEWIWNQMRYADGSLASVAYGNHIRGTGNLNDYAYTAEAFLALAAVIDWLRPGDSAIWTERAGVLLEQAETLFSDPDGFGYYFTSVSQEPLVHRKKDWYDNATPAGISCLIHAHAYMYALTGDARSAKVLGELETAYPGIMNTSPAAASHALSGLVYRAIGHAVIKVRPGTGLEDLRRALVSRPWRPVFLVVDSTQQLPATYQLCVGSNCLEPTNHLQEIIEKL